MNPFTRTREQVGAAAVEMAVVLPLLILFVFGIVQFGIAYNRTQGMHAAAREGARFASVGSDFEDVRDRVRATQSLFDPADVAVVVVRIDKDTAAETTMASGDVACASYGDSVRVEASITDPTAYELTIPLWGTISPDYSADATFRCE